MQHPKKVYFEHLTKNDQAKERAMIWLFETYSEEEENCSDNFRIAEMGNSEEEAEYNKQKEKGCCGFIDVSYYDRSTKRSFLVGFNYGH